MHRPRNRPMPISRFTLICDNQATKYTLHYAVTKYNRVRRRALTSKKEFRRQGSTLVIDFHWTLPRMYNGMHLHTADRNNSISEFHRYGTFLKTQYGSAVHQIRAMVTSVSKFPPCTSTKASITTYFVLRSLSENSDTQLDDSQVPRRERGRHWNPTQSTNLHIGARSGWKPFKPV